MSKKDDVANKYSISNKVIRIYNILFWSLSLQIVVGSYFDLIDSPIYISFQIGISILLISIKIIDNNFSWFNAEASRRKSTIKDGFNLNIQKEETVDYYNNSFKPSIYRYGINIFESNYFSYRIARYMLSNAFIKSILSIFLLVLLSRYVLDNNFYLLITQTIVSISYIEDGINLYFYYSRLQELYNQAYNYFITEKCNEKNLSWIQWYAVEYESIKSYYKIRLCSKVFNKRNLELSNEWNQISSNLEA